MDISMVWSEILCRLLMNGYKSTTYHWNFAQISLSLTHFFLKIKLIIFSLVGKSYIMPIWFLKCMWNYNIGHISCFLACISVCKALFRMPTALWNTWKAWNLVWLFNPGNSLEFCVKMLNLIEICERQTIESIHIFSLSTFHTVVIKHF